MNPQTRYHSLDAVRAIALLAGIVLHSTMSFFLILPGQDSSQSTTLAVLFYVIHIFRMTSFFIIAGFFAHLVVHRRGVRAFIQDRSRRIVLPMIVGWLILAPLLGALTIWGLIRTFGIQEDAEPLPYNGLPLTHLWFLYYLCLFYLAVLALKWLADSVVDKSGKLRKSLDRLMGFLMCNPLAPAFLAIPGFIQFSYNSSWAPWFGIPTPDVGLTPQLPAMVSYGSAFFFGWLLHRQPNLLSCWEQRWQFNLIAAVMLTFICLNLVGLTPDLFNPLAVGDAPWQRSVYIACYTSAAWFWSFGLIGAAMRFLSNESKTWRYMADASYWLYLAHLPIVFFLQVSLLKVGLHWSLKFPFIVLLTTGLLLLSYHYLVRPTFLGKILNGRKYPRAGRQQEIRSTAV